VWKTIEINRKKWQPSKSQTPEQEHSKRKQNETSACHTDFTIREESPLPLAEIRVKERPSKFYQHGHWQF
jgi:hypothetical protein